MNWYLKCYYGYKNWWDELLALWFIQRIFYNYDIEKLYIEAWDEIWMMKWLKINNKLLDENIIERIEIVWKNWYKKLWSSLKFFLGWWELFTDQRRFPYDWRNYLLKLWKRIWWWNVVMAWWIGKARKIRTKILYNLTLRQAEKIICREKTSFELAKKYNKNTELYHDFALDVINKCKEWIEIKESAYILINVNSHIMNNKKSAEKILNFIKENKGKQFCFFPCAFYDDLKYYDYFCTQIPNLKLYDRTKHSIQDTLNFLAGCENAIWTRLHFLLVLKYFGKKFIPIVYQEKIEKMILQN